MPITIEEVKNDKYNIVPVKMANDAIIPNIDPPISDKYGFFCLLIGKPNSGKSTYWINLLQKSKNKNSYYKKFDKVHIFSNSLKTITTKLKLPEDRLHHGVDDLEEVVESEKDSDNKLLFIIDDCVTDLKDSDFMLKLIYNRRHIAKSISIIITSQVYNKISLKIRKCCNDLVLFNTGSKKELQSIYDDLINIDKDDYYKIIKHCFSGSSHDFLVFKTEDGSWFHNFNRLNISED
jgi:hypothetical protein